MSKEIISADERLDSVNEKITLIQKKDGLTFGTDAFLLAAFMKEQKRAYAVELRDRARLKSLHKSLSYNFISQHAGCHRCI